MHKGMLVIGWCLLSASVFAQTYVSGDVSGTWTKANSPYIVTADMRVVAGTALAIQPGVQVRFAARYCLKVYGLLTAAGVAGDSVIFTHHINHADSLWRGIRFFSADPACLLDYCRVEYGMAASGQNGGGISCDKSRLTIKNSRIANNRAPSASTAGGGLFSFTSHLTIVNTIFADNFSDYEGGAICIRQGGSMIIINCIFNRNSRGSSGAIKNYNSFNLWVIGSVFANNKGTASDIDNHLGNVNLINCLFYQKVRPSSANISSYAGKIRTINSIFVKPGPIVIDEQLYCDFFDPNTVPKPGNGNIFVDPQLVDPDAGDFRLKSTSPCIDTGYPWSLYNDLDGSRNNMGHSGGTGLAALPVSLDFGYVGGGASLKLPWELLNGRDAALTISSGLMGNTTDYSTDFTAPMTLPAATLDTINFTFQPAASGLLATQFTMNSPALASPVVLDLQGYGGVWCGEVSGVWTKAHSPYYIGCNLLVPAGMSLTIEPGVQVLVDTTLAGSSATFTVAGTLLAAGSEADSILFSVVSGQQGRGNWDGLIISDGGTANLDYCRISYAKGGIVAREQTVTINHSVISECSGDGVLFSGYEGAASGQIRNSVVKNNGGWGIDCDAYCEDAAASASPVIEKVMVTGNTLGGILASAWGGTPGDWNTNSRRAYASPSIQSCQILHNSGPGLQIEASGEYGEGSPLDHKSYAYASPSVIGSVFAHNQQGVRTTCYPTEVLRLSYAEPVIERSTFYGNGAVKLYATDSAIVTIRNSIFAGAPTGTITAQNGAQIHITYSDLETSYTGTGNLAIDPFFVNEAGGDYHLQEKSSCIDVGDPASSKDPDSTRADMGAYYYNQIRTVQYNFTAAGWQLVSLPVQPADSTVSVLFPTAVGGRAYSWNQMTGQYDQAVKMEPGKGYWLSIPGAASAQVTGLPLRQFSGTSQQGWYLIGAPASGMNLAGLEVDPAGQVYSPAFGWDSGNHRYLSSAVLAEKSGYWLAVKGACSFTARGSLYAGLSKEAVLPERPFADLSSMPPPPPELDTEPAKEALPERFALRGNYPNPFNAATIIEMDLPHAVMVSLRIINIRGECIRVLVDSQLPARSHKVLWDGCDDTGVHVASGVYFCKMAAGAFQSSRKMILMN